MYMLYSFNIQCELICEIVFPRHLSKRCTLWENGLNQQLSFNKENWEVGCKYRENPRNKIEDSDYPVA